MNKTNRFRRQKRSESDLKSELISLRRVAKVTAGAKRLRFSAVVAVGDSKGGIGLALSHGADAQEAIRKAREKAGRSLIKIKMNLEAKTIARREEAKYKAVTIIIKPAPLGVGIVAGGSIRKMLELMGIENVVAKSLGSKNRITNAYCAMMLFNKLKV